MLDSLLFLPDDVDGAAVDVQLDIQPAAASASHGRDDAEAVAAVAATRDGHAHAARGAWDAAGAALERAAAMRDGLVAAGLAGPVVAARGWSDLAAVRVASGDLEAARAAFARVRAATRGLADLPADVAAAVAELEAALGPSVAEASDAVALAGAPAMADAPADAFATGLLWLDTTDASTEDSTEDVAIARPAGAAALVDAPAAPTRIAAIDDAIALAHAGGATTAGSTGILTRLRRLLRR